MVRLDRDLYKQLQQIKLDTDAASVNDVIAEKFASVEVGSEVNELKNEIIHLKNVLYLAVYTYYNQMIGTQSTDDALFRECTNKSTNAMFDDAEKEVKFLTLSEKQLDQSKKAKTDAAKAKHLNASKANAAKSKAHENKCTAWFKGSK